MRNKETIKAIEKIYPPVFIEEISHGQAILRNGKQETTYIRRLSNEEQSILDNIITILKQ